MNRHRLFYLLTLIVLLAACNLPGAGTQTSVPDATLTPLGTKENPVILATSPGASSEAVASAEQIAARLSSLTGLVIVTAPAESYTNLIESLGDGTVHIASLPPLAYLLAHEKGYADVALGTLVAGQERVASQFMVSAARLVGEKGFKVYFDPDTGANMVEVATALAQFKDKKPCWTDAYSTAGYVLPLEILTDNRVPTKTGAFLQGEATVVKTLYRDTEGALCDFGVTSADSRLAVVADYPDVNQKVVIVWRTDPVIPFDGIAYAESLPDDLRIRITAGFLAIAASEDGLATLRSAYQIDGLKLIDDTFYDDLRKYIQSSGLELPSFIR
jgi:phosphonate transport system substrate-binding protein